MDELYVLSNPLCHSISIEETILAAPQRGGAVAVFIINFLTLIMYRYFESKDNDSFLMQDPVYCDIMRKLDGFMAALNIDDKALLSQLISECYHKHHKAIQAKSHNDIELFHSLIMTLLIEQSNEIKRLQKTRR
jgi:hypothetical protein